MPSARRWGAVGCLIVAGPVAIAATTPGFNSADVLAAALPLIFIAACWPLIKESS